MTTSTLPALAPFDFNADTPTFCRLMALGLPEAHARIARANIWQTMLPGDAMALHSLRLSDAAGAYIEVDIRCGDNDRDFHGQTITFCLPTTEMLA